MSGRWEKGQAVYWVDKLADERSGSVVDGSELHVSVRTTLGLESYAENQVFATPLEAWEAFYAYAAREEDHFGRQYEAWASHRQTALMAITRLKHEASEAVTQ